MFELWYARRQERQIFKRYRRGIRRFPVGSSEQEQFTTDFANNIGRAEAWTGFIWHRKLSQEAKRYDLELPLGEGDWTEGEVLKNTPARYLSPTGRLTLRRLIDAEKARRFEVRTLWVTKFWLPLLTALVGLIGAATGFIAVWRHGK
jgi:hypothetical protein